MAQEPSLKRHRMKKWEEHRGTLPGESSQELQVSLSCAWDMMATPVRRANSTKIDEHTGGSAIPRGVGWGATGVEDVVSAQNQPIAKILRKKRQRVAERRLEI